MTTAILWLVKDAAQKVRVRVARRLSTIYREGRMPHEAHEMGMSSEMRQCIDDCLSCASVCTETLRHCLMMGGKHTEAQHVTIMLDCAEICQTSANFMLRQSAAHVETCGTCAAVCRACEESCRQIGGEVMLRCADECAKCAESCERMAGLSSA